MRRRRVLLSAFACAPDWGGEPAVGWHWACELASRHDVTVLTHERFRQRIEAAVGSAPRSGLRFEFVGRDGPEAVLQRRVDSHGHYLAWQWQARRRARALHRQQPFDLIHHLTWGSWRLPCGLAGLGPPLVLGPVGGGDDAPAAWRQSWPWQEQLRYLLRTLWTASGRWDPLLQRVLEGTALILAKTPATQASLPGRFQRRTELALEIGCPDLQTLAPAALASDRGLPRVNAEIVPPLRLLYAGRLIGGKGVVYAVDATLALAARGLDVRLQVVGAGRLGAWLRARVAGSATPQAVLFSGALPHGDLLRAYAEADLLVFPSWHDSSGNVVIEALASGLPVLCLDRAGPREVVCAASALIVRAEVATEQALVQSIAAAIEELASDRGRLQRMSLAASARAASLSWPRQVARAYDLIEQRLGWPRVGTP